MFALKPKALTIQFIFWLCVVLLAIPFMPKSYIASSCLNNGEIVSETPISDVNPGQHFTKRWRIKNTGSCPWMSGYQWVFVGGNQMHGPASVAIQDVTSSGFEFELWLNLVAPTTTGHHQGVWQLQNPQGNRVGPQLIVQVNVSGSSVSGTSQSKRESSGAQASPVPVQNCTNSAMLVDDEPISSQVAPRQAFTKRWRVKNTGSCSWGPGYRWVFVGGNQMYGPSVVPIQDLTTEGFDFTFWVNLVAPAAQGPHQGYWQLEDPNGNQFGPRVMVQIN